MGNRGDQFMALFVHRREFSFFSMELDQKQGHHNEYERQFSGTAFLITQKVYFSSDKMSQMQHK